MIKRNSFSLLEMMVVIGIIGFLAATMVVGFTDSADKAAIATTKATIQQVEGALKMYYLSNRKYPSSENGLELLVQEKVLTILPRDAWNNEIQYQYPGSGENKFDLWSLGADGMDGGTDFDKDIYNKEDDEY